MLKLGEVKALDNVVAPKLARRRVLAKRKVDAGGSGILE
jgi:hypothetical protein